MKPTPWDPGVDGLEAVYVDRRASHIGRHPLEGIVPGVVRGVSPSGEDFLWIPKILPDLPDG